MKNRVGVLNRFTGLLTRRNINIENAVIISTSKHQVEAKVELRTEKAQNLTHLKRVLAKQIDILSVSWYSCESAAETTALLVAGIEKNN
ncbi:ACT domain-containing protein [Liquorilactobacillus satsumensis]|nr:ACT domain-containing protein [Liquorilactobacillus satsumensis]